MRRALPLIIVVAVVAVATALITCRGGGAPKAPPSDHLVQDIERLFAQGDAISARRVIAERRADLPAHRLDYFDALIAFKAQDYAKASDAAAKAVAAAPDDWRNVSLYYYAEVRRSHPTKALEVLRAYLARNENDERALATEAEYWVAVEPRATDPARSLALVAKIDGLPKRVAPEPDTTAVTKAQLDRIRAAAESMRGLTNAAVAAAMDRTKSSPQNPSAWAELGEMQRRAGAMDPARVALRRARELAPQDPQWTESLLLLLLETDETGAEALPLAEALVKLVPNSPQAQILLARSLVRQGSGERIGDAITIYRALLLRPDLGKRERQDALRNCAVALYDWKQGGQAGDYLDEAHRLLAEYVRSGGVIDERIEDTWTQLEEHMRRRGVAGTPEPGPTKR